MIDLSISCGNTASSTESCIHARIHDGMLIECSPCASLRATLEYQDILEYRDPFQGQELACWAFTLTYKQDPGGWNDLHKQMRASYPKLVRMLKRCARDWGFTPEIQEARNRIHYHGWMIVKDKIKFFKDFYSKCKSNGFTCFKKIMTTKDLIRWKAYCTKWNKENSIIFSHNSKPINIIFTPDNY